MAAGFAWGIDFTFGFFTAVDVMANELLNLRADAMATSGYFVVETMGRKAGWLAYGVAIAGEAHLVVGVEDVVGDLAIEESVRDPETGASRPRSRPGARGSCRRNKLAFAVSGIGNGRPQTLHAAAAAGLMGLAA